MRGAETLIPARFLTLVGHLCVVITLLWESQRSVKHCLPSQFHSQYLEIYHNRLVAGLATSLALILVELLTFIFGLTMFSSSASFISISSHGLGTILLTHFVLDGWRCDWFWTVFLVCSVFPSLVDLTTAVSNEHQQLTEPQQNGYRGGWSFYLALAAVATTLGASLPVGYNIGVVNTPAEVIKRFCVNSFSTRYGVVLNEQWLSFLWSCIVSIFIVGGCTGSVIGAVLADKLGRKKATIVTNLLFIVGAVMFGCCQAANSVEMLLLGRLLVGLSSGLTTSIVPMYLTELAPLNLTGTLGVVCPMGVNVGVLVGQVMGLESLLGGVNDWPYLLSVYAILVIICLPLICLLPESPKYLFTIRRDEDTAIRELSKIRGVSPSILTEDLELLREETLAAQAASSQRWTMLQVLRDRRLLLPLLLTCSMQAGQQTSGINAVFYYSKTAIFKKAGLSDTTAQYATIGCGFINVCTALIMIPLLTRVGRRPLLLGSVLAATVILSGLAAAMSYIHVSGMPYVCMAAVLAYVLVYGFGLGPIPYFIASEMFEVGPRPAGMAWGSLANWAGNFLVAMCFPLMRNHIGPFSFLVFAAFTGALFVLQKLYFPETRGKTPTQVAQLCSRGFSSRPTRLLTPTASV